MVIVVRVKDPEDIIGVKESLCYAVERVAEVDRADVYGDAEYRQMMNRGKGGSVNERREKLL
jgi:hypothetical protein